MLNFIFSPDWYLLGLIASTVHILVWAYIVNKPSNNNNNDDDFWALFWSHMIIWVIVPILTPIVILITVVFNIDFEELKSDFSEWVNIKSKNSNKSSVNKDNREYKGKIKIIESKLEEFILFLRNKKWIAEHGRYNYDKLDLGYTVVENISLSSWASSTNISSIMRTSFRFGKDKDYQKIHNKLYDIAIGTVDFYNSVFSDSFLGDREISELIKDFNNNVDNIMSKIINDEKIIIEEIKRKENEIKKAKEEELSKISYEKLNEAKESMLNTLNIVAGTNKR